MAVEPGAEDRAVRAQREGVALAHGEGGDPVPEVRHGHARGLRAVGQDVTQFTRSPCETKFSDHEVVRNDVKR